MAFRALIGASYLQHVCKHFTSWSARQPQPVPTGKCGLCLANQPVCVHLAAARISQASQLSAATIAWASIEALAVKLSCKIPRVQTSTHKIEKSMCHDLTGCGNPLIDVVPSSRGIQVSLLQDLRRPSRTTGARQAGRARPCRHAALAGHQDTSSIPLTMPVPGPRRGRGVSERPATSSTDSTPAIDVHPNVRVSNLFAPSCGLQSRQSCCDWSPARINQAKCWSGRHYVGTAGCAPPDQDIPARRISSAWRPTYTPSYIVWYLYTDIPQAPPPSPESSRLSIY